MLNCPNRDFCKITSFAQRQFPMFKHSFLLGSLLIILFSGTSAKSKPFTSSTIANFNSPWAMTFLPDGHLLVSEKKGQLYRVTQSGQKSGPIKGLPKVDHGGQGGLGDVVLHPQFSENKLIYISYVEKGEKNTRGAVVARAKLVTHSAKQLELSEMQVIWRQWPTVSGRGHYGQRLAFSPEGYLFISSGDRQKFHPAQDMEKNLGKIIRLNDDGSVPKNNPFANQGGITAQIWSLGHRNPLGLAFDSQGRLWNQEMGPRHGDELNLVIKGKNYGYPTVSNGNHYDGRKIPDHDTRPEFEAPKAYWVPAISPAGLMFYSGSLFPEWKGNAFLGGLSSRSLVRVAVDGSSANELERYDMGARIREIEQGPKGALWILEDGGRLLRLDPKT
ncbi:MAG: glucose/arabinose dehydrogenase [Dinoroseobacter sp.]|jgi:glucose/arabinose dehydrogenase